MKTSSYLASAALLAAMFTSAPSLAATTVTLEKMHLCCGACENAVKRGAAKIEGVACTTSQEASTAVLTADSLEMIQKAIDEIAKNGMSGKPNNEGVAFPEIEVPEGKVTKLEFVKLHNCCDGCTFALQEKLKEVEGYTSDTVVSHVEEFTVLGNFKATDITKAIREAGFYAVLKGNEEKE